MEAIDLLVPQSLPGGRTQLRCRACGCSVPSTHVPRSAGCDEDRTERLESHREW
jgi:hypothetical protein